MSLMRAAGLRRVCLDACRDLAKLGDPKEPRGWARLGAALKPHARDRYRQRLAHALQVRRRGHIRILV